MTLILQKMWQNYLYFMDNNSHPVSKNFFLMSSPFPLLIILAVYLYFCMVAGPRYMKDKAPYELKNTILLYNVIQIVVNLFLIYEGAVCGWFTHYSFYCQPVDYSNDPVVLRYASGSWIYFMLKISELLDTVFFVLRKKDKQITSLHLYHHTLMAMSSWIGVRFVPNGHGTFLGYINSYVHVIMYAYYMIAGLGPQYQKYLWWKKYITVMQLVQFCIIFLHSFTVLFRDCNYPKMINVLICIECIVFINMFGQFYYQSYVKKANKAKEEISHSNNKLK